MIRRRTSRRFVAWLAIAAMWLLVGAPTVSRVLPMLASGESGAWCAGHAAGADLALMSDMPGMADMPGMVHMPGMPEQPGDPAQHMDHCGYCALLSHTPLLSGGVVALLLATPLPVVSPAAPASASWHAQPLLSARPRGPPSVLMG
ncbi:DUF2946 domain-containing protein [Dyella telluris]|uniref:DUF2946 domain-containing protein n=1 Tax=Dyella telluris TaxID=2763498 RepID=A0A7G8Q3Y5_9GAMM|nr:DUF2946 domain-containing protein [Dyella telluris]QNK01493.1 DUF2946 domain-containing protein [Dyella telluris]